ncbi:MAG: bifunctional metallophosphatase/5'-nucleotidase [Anaerolineae bacterium]|nr:bifunctional metallophosphatase/5'-nucleotidase [Anaerolineae bacterium]
MFRLRVFHFNDLHGRLADLDAESFAPVFSRIAGHVAAARAACAGQGGEGVLFFSGGDDLVGSPFAELMGTRPEEFRAHPAYRLYSAAGVDGGAIGNHDLDWGLGMLSLAAQRDATFPLLSANLIADREYPGILPATVLTVNGLRVGVIGVTTPAEIKHCAPEELLLITDPVEAVRQHAARLRAGCDTLIVLSHLGYSLDHPAGIVAGAGDVELANALPAGTVDLILGAHTHHALNEDALAPVCVNGVCIAQAGAFGRYLGEVIIEVTEGGARVTEARLLPVDSLPPDPLFDAAFTEPLAREVTALLAEPLGVAEAHPDLHFEAPGGAFTGEEAALANFVADALAARCRAAGIPVDFAMVDASVIAAGLPEGPLTLRDLHRLSPFADSIITFELPRREFGAFLDDNARRATWADEPAEERGFAQFSREVRYEIAAGSGRGETRAANATLRGEPVDDAGGTPLLVACGSFARAPARAWERGARGQGHAVFELSERSFGQTGLPLRAELAAYMREAGGVTAAAGLRRDGRVRRL